MTTPHEKELTQLRARLAEAEQELEAWRSYDMKAAEGPTYNETLSRVLAFRRAYPGIQNNVCARMLVALYDHKGPLSCETLDELVPMTWTGRKSFNERKDIRGYFSTLACFIRREMGFDALSTKWGIGYELTPAGRAKLDAIWGSELT